MEKVCIKCAKCNPVCSTFLESFDEVYAPRGYLHLCELVERGEMEAKEASQILSTCTKCGDCEPLCPIDLPIVSMIAQVLDQFQCLDDMGERDRSIERIKSDF